MCLFHVSLFQRDSILLQEFRVGATTRCHYRGCHVVLCLHSSCLSRSLLWIQGGNHYLPDCHVDDCSSHSDSSSRSQPQVAHDYHRHCSICGRLRGTLFHHDQHVDGPVLLRLWLHAHCLYCPFSYMRRSDSLARLLPIVCGKSRVVVVFVHYFGIDCLLHVCVFHLLVPKLGSISHAHDVHALLWIHVFSVLCHFPRDRIGGCHDVLVVYSQNLFHHQGGLIAVY
mmetsp:Transcript_28182/g.51014  ORF Transcript_28182/g.51014 Transcript_28182/m.51014 type:complete len:226 (+) Transcript_28182:786-1463(+)